VQICVEEIDGLAVSVLGVRSRKLSNVRRVWSSDGSPIMFYIATEITLSRWSWMHMQLVPTNQHWARMLGYSPFSLYVIHKEGLCPSSIDMNKLMMVMMNCVDISVKTSSSSVISEELDGLAVSGLRCVVTEVKQRWSVI
jgi:hypothetical protein